MHVSITVPRLNSNEDQYMLIGVYTRNGALVEKDDLLFVVEGTKAATEIHAPTSGKISGVTNIKTGGFVSVGSVICQISDSDEDAEKDAPISSKAVDDNRVTLKARIRANELDINLEDIPSTGGPIKVSDVEAFHAARSFLPTLAAYVKPDLPHRKAVIIGAGGHAAVILDTLAGLENQIIGCTDPDIPTGTEVFGGVKVIGTDETLPGLLSEGVTAAYIGVGGPWDGSARRKLFDMAQNMGFDLPPAISRHARLSSVIAVGPGTMIGASADIGPRCRIGANVIVNCGAIVSHDCVIEDDVHLAPGAILAGSVTVGRGSTIGMAATVYFGKRIGRNCLVYNGVAVASDLPPRTEMGHDRLLRTPGTDEW